MSAMDYSGPIDVEEGPTDAMWSRPSCSSCR